MYHNYMAGHKADEKSTSRVRHWTLQYVACVMGAFLEGDLSTVNQMNHPCRSCFCRICYGSYDSTLIPRCIGRRSLLHHDATRLIETCKNLALLPSRLQRKHYNRKVCHLLNSAGVKSCPVSFPSSFGFSLALFLLHRLPDRL